MIHALKTWPLYFEALLTGGKNFELRKYDRPFCVGDTLLLQEWDPETKEYSRREIEKRIGYILASPECGVPGLMEGYCIIGFDEVYS